MSAKKIVQTYLDAFYRDNKQLDVIERLLTDDFQFLGPLAAYDGRTSFMRFITESGVQKNQITVRKILVDGNDIAVFHDFRSQTPVIGPLPFAEWYTLRDDKICSLQIYFDAREFAARIRAYEATPH